MSEIIDSVTIEPKSPANACVIWLHGLGADGHDFEPIVQELNLPNSLAVKFIFPHAPFRRITINGGMVMRAWCDIISLGEETIINHDEILESDRTIQQLIEQQIANGIPANKIVLAGFSLGGALAIHTALHFTQSLGGIIALSTFLTKDSQLETEAHQANKNIPIFMGHGTHDMLAPIALGLKTCKYLQQLNYQVEWQSYQMEHTVCHEEIIDISNWLQKTVG